MNSFIDENKINELLTNAENPSKEKILSLIEKAKTLKGLSPEETALLLQCNDKELIEDIKKTAREVKENIYGNRLVLFAPLYLTNSCVNNCLYCSFRKDNTDIVRKTLSLDEIKKETEALIGQGHKRLLVVAGEDSREETLDYLEKAVSTIYSIKNKLGNIRRININIAPLDADSFKRLKSMNIGTYQVFQETYHLPTYKEVHLEGPKSDYDWRLSAVDRAMEAGINDVGIGALFGLYNYKFEVLALIIHSIHLEEKFGFGPHTISVPRIESAQNAPLTKDIPHEVSNDDFMKLVAILRLAVPYTGLILSTRETPPFRDEVIELGISQISAGSKTSPGAYSQNSDKAGQFSIHDTRTQKEIIKDIIKKGFLPSFCTACYRLGRTGKDFMDLAKPGEIKNFCQANCILTFKEYLLDFGDDSLLHEGNPLIERELEKIPDEKVRLQAEEKIKLLESGERDLYF